MMRARMLWRLSGSRPTGYDLSENDTKENTKSRDKPKMQVGTQQQKSLRDARMSRYACNIEG
jgi:hypothetical protein